MRLVWMWATRHVRRRPLEVLAIVVTTALSIGLIGSLGTFLAETRADVTAHATSNVAVDWQVQLTSRAEPNAVRSAIAGLAHRRASRDVAYATVAALSSGGPSGNRTTGRAFVAAIPSDYGQAFPSAIRALLGTTGGPVLLQQTAANLGAAPGSTIDVSPAPGAPAVPVTIVGVVDLPQSATFFQTIGATAPPAATPDNVLLVPPDVFSRLTPGRPVVSQIHVGLDRGWLPPDPGSAAARVSTLQHALEAAVPGSVAVGDNLEAALLGAREDALYGQLLFLMLGIPAFVVALGLVAAVARTSAPRRRQEDALMSLHGTPPRVRRLALLSELITPAALGALLAWPLTLATTRSTLGHTGLSVPWFVVGAVCCAATLLVTGRVRRETDVVHRAGPSVYSVPNQQLPRPLRYGLDVALLAMGTAVFVLVSRGRYQVVVAPEGVATTSVDWAALLGPALVLPGLALLTLRLTHAVARSLPSRPRGDGRELVLASVRRRCRPIAAGAATLVLSLGVAGAAAVFDRTYQDQAAVDVALTVGSDVAVTLPDSSGQAAAVVSHTPGVGAVSAQVHRLAYVGNDLQDLFGIDPSTIRNATYLRDDFVPGSTVASALARLRADPHGVLLSAETLHDYQLHVGDPIRLRLRGQAGYVAQPFVVSGQVSEWPTAPKDSFIVANETYLHQVTSDPGTTTLLVKTPQRQSVAAALRQALGPRALITDATTARSTVTTASGLAAVDLHGLTRLELGAGLLLTAASLALTLALGITGRRRTLAVLATLSASARQRRRFVVTDAYLTVGAGLVGGLATAGVVGFLYVRVLNGIFDPPPHAPSVPWRYLSLLVATVVAVAIVATATASRWVRADPAVLRDDEG